MLDERVFVSLGVLKVAAAVEQAGGKVALIDLSGVVDYAEVVRTFASNTDITWFGITATTPQMPAATEIVKVIRKAKPEAKIMLGGAHATLVAAAYKRQPSGRAEKSFVQLKETYDSIVAGDGERAVIKVLQTGASFVDADDPDSKYFLDSSDIAKEPLPARHLVDLDSYVYKIDGVRATNLITQLGCPFSCAFCGGRESPMLRRMRTRPAEAVIEEILTLYKTYGFTGFQLYDDELNVNRGFTRLLYMLRKLSDDCGVQFHFRGFVKAELLTAQQAVAMREAGFSWVLIGFESGSDRILRNMGKRAVSAVNTRSVDIARAAGLKVKALMSIGHPGESTCTLEETQNWLLKTQPDDFDVTIISVYPGSYYYDHAKETSPGIWTYQSLNGDKLHSIDVDYTKVADYYKGDPNGGYQSYVYTDQLSAAEIVACRNSIESHVRQTLKIAYPMAASTTRFEHSMGQGLPSTILRRTCES